MSHPITRCLLIAATLSGLYTSAQALDLGYIARPIEDFPCPAFQNDSTVQTLMDVQKEAGFFPLGKALVTIGRTDLAGVSPTLDTFEVNPFDGAPDATTSWNSFEEPVGFSSNSNRIATRARTSTHSSGLTAQSNQSNRITSSRITRVSIRQ